MFDAINQGRLVTSVQRKDSGRFLVDVEAADAEWQANTDANRGSLAHMKNRAPAPAVSDDEPPQTYAEARAQHERFKARLAQLEMEEREAKLVEVDAVKREAFKVARQVRDSLLNLPDRIAAELAAEPNQFKVHQKLTKEIRRALEDLKFE